MVLVLSCNAVLSQGRRNPVDGLVAAAVRGELAAAEAKRIFQNCKGNLVVSGDT